MRSINEDIKSGQLKQMYLLYGPEDYLRLQYRDKLKAALAGDDTMNCHYYEGKDVNVGEIIDLAETMPFLAERRVIIIENSGLFKAGGEEMASYLGGISESAYFLFAEKEIDRRSKLFKAVQSGGRAIEFGVQDDATLQKWVMGLISAEGKKISPRDVAYFLTSVGSDMSNIKTELEKLVCYAMKRDTITAADIDAVCTREITDHVFEMVDAIAVRDRRKAMRLYQDLLALKVPPLRTLALIARQYNLLLQVRMLLASYRDPYTIADKTGINKYFVKKYISQASAFTADALKSALERAVDTEEAVKTGRLSEKLCVELLLVEYTTA
ncbi:MAG: DNA polymerase III subunit delta [Lachnospiraceae bacterium]|nr:DNA polymerase III subunit delta [Lachnospiraceae bacterium]